MHSIDSTHTYAYGTSKDLLSEEENKCNNTKKKKNVINFDDFQKKT